MKLKSQVRKPPAGAVVRGDEHAVERGEERSVPAVLGGARRVRPRGGAVDRARAPVRAKLGAPAPVVGRGLRAGRPCRYLPPSDASVSAGHLPDAQVVQSAARQRQRQFIRGQILLLAI